MSLYLGATFLGTDDSARVYLGDRAVRLSPPSLQTLFQPSDIGGLWDFADTSGLRMLHDGTGTAAVVTDPIGYMADVSGKGKHAIQSTGANKPTLRQTSTTGRYWLEAETATKALNVTFASAPGTMYVGRVTPEGIEWATEDWSTTTKSLVAMGTYNAGIIARSREFTANEKALVERYFSRQLPTLGPQLYANNSFETDTAWTKGPGWTIANGVATAFKAAGVAPYNLTQVVPIALGTLVFAKMNVSRFASGSPYFFGIPAPSIPSSIYPAFLKMSGYATAVNVGPRHGATIATDFDVSEAFLHEVL